MPEGAAPLLYRGRAWRFCGMGCRLAFKRSPEACADAAPELSSAPEAPASTALPRERAPGPFKIRG